MKETETDDTASWVSLSEALALVIEKAAKSYGGRAAQRNDERREKMRNRVLGE